MFLSAAAKEDGIGLALVNLDSSVLEGKSFVVVVCKFDFVVLVCKHTEKKEETTMVVCGISKRQKTVLHPHNLPHHPLDILNTGGEANMAITWNK